MSKKTIISGYQFNFLKSAIQLLEENKIISIEKWILPEEAINEIHKNEIWWWNIVYKEKFYGRSILSEEEEKYLFSKFPIFEQHLVREKIFELDSQYELRNIIIKFAYYFIYIIKIKRIELILFSDVPHGAYDVILYYVAKMLNVRTIFLMGSFWAGRTFIYEDINDIGTFKIDGNKKLDIEEKFEKRLPYMDKSSSFEEVKEKLEVILKFKYWYQSKKETFQRNLVMYGNVENYILKHIERWSKRKVAKNTFKYNYSKYFTESIGNDKFVYFPLHLQPEMTTDTLGGVYFDQLLAIEKLRNVLPSDWYIYVKENPKQESYMRGQRFYDRINSIENVKLLGKDVSTYEIMKKCQFVATITGTAGWEAITGGKQALVFGFAWYRYFPGVSIYHENINIDKVLSKKIDHNKIEEGAYYLKNITKDFYINNYHEKFSENNEEENNDKLYKSLSQII